jgi:hypothetical protein
MCRTSISPLLFFETIMMYKGGCHCGNIAFEVEGDLDEVTACNCSLCTKNGLVLWFLPAGHLRLLTPEANVSTYKFNQKILHFCQMCGSSPYGEAPDPKTGEMMVAVNVHCLENVDIHKLKIIPIGGIKPVEEEKNLNKI